MSSEESARERSPKPGRAKRPGIADVAKLAGVSTTTVSYVLNDTPPYASQFSEETRERVFRAAEELNYRPNIYAAGLRNRTSTLYGAYVGQTDPPHPSWPPQIVSLLFGLSTLSSELSMLPVMRVDKAEDPDEERILIRQLIRAGVQGLLTTYPSDTIIHELRTFRKKRFPFLVIFGNRCQGKFDNWIDVDNVEFGRMMARALVERGHRKVVCLAGDVDLPHPAMRLQGFREVMAEAGVEVSEYLTTRHRAEEAAAGESVDHDAETTNLVARFKPTAIAGLTSGSTMFGWTAIHRLKLAVPADISILGSETDFSPIPDVRDIDCVSCDWEDMGRRGVSILHALITDSNPPRLPMLVPPRFVPGKTLAVV